MQNKLIKTFNYQNLERKKKLLRQIAGSRLPSILEILAIRATIFEAVEFSANRGAFRGVEERVGFIIHPFSFVKIAVL